MIKILHGADFHLDSAFSALTPEQSVRRRQEQREALGQLAELCKDCDLVLLAGDLFDSSHIYRDTLEALKQFFASVRAEIFIAPGNHDFISPGSPYLTENWGENVHIFTSSTVEKVTLERLKCDIYGAGFTSPHMPSLLQDFRVEDPLKNNIMVLHGELSPASTYNPILPEQVASSGLDYLALGHVHSGDLRSYGRTLCAWPGCLMGRGYDECGEKGVYQITLDGGRKQVDFIPLPGRKYEILEVEVVEDPLSSVLSALPGDTSRDCYRILLTGEADPVDLAQLEQQLSSRFFSLRLRDQTTPRKALWEQAGEDTLRGHFLERLKGSYDSADETQRERILMAARLVTALMDGREVPL